jgi:putative DNA primase/helicase
MAVFSETSAGGALNEALIKDMTGGEPLRARKMRQDFWEFTPTHKGIICTNHKPEIRGSDPAIWRRPLLVLFPVRFWNPEDFPPGFAGDAQHPPHLKQNKRLVEELLEEAPGILAWLVKGAVDWRRDGLAVPECVRVATREYRIAEDVLGHFLEECCNIDPTETMRTRSSTLYKCYKKWCEASGYRARSATSFGTALTERGFDREKSGERYYLGIALRQEAANEYLDSQDLFASDTI